MSDRATVMLILLSLIIFFGVFAMFVVEYHAVTGEWF